MRHPFFDPSRVALQRWLGPAALGAASAFAGATEPPAAPPAPPLWLAVLSPGNAQRSGAAVPGDWSETAVRQAALAATWPADIVQWCSLYLRLPVPQPWADEATALQRQAALAAEVLRRGDVHLYRSAFVPLPTAGAPGHSIDPSLRQAALGDAASALLQARLAQQQGQAHRQLGWLQFAAALGSDEAAYALALHYRRESQPLLAAQFEARAVALGFQPPPALGHRR